MPAETVNWKVVLVVNAPSETLSVIVVVPDCPLAGVSTTLRLAPNPLNAIPLNGTNVLFDDDAVTFKLPADVSASPTVNAIAGVAVWKGVT